MEYKEFSAKTVADAITAACSYYIASSSSIEYEVIEEGSNGFLGIGAKPAVIKARIKEEADENTSVFVENKEEKKEEVVSKKEEKPVKKEEKTPVKEEVKKEEIKKEEAPAKKKDINVNAAEVEKKAVDFLKEVLDKMEIKNEVNASYDANNNCLNIEIAGDDMGVLIGKRGQTLDSLQYIVSLVVNKGTKEYIRVKVDTENYRERRKKTLENLAKNMAFKVKRTRRPVTLEPMNPYERRVIHSALQNDSYVTTHSEGEEPYRKVVITLKK